MKLLYFASLREKIGTGEEAVDLPASVATVAGLIDWLKTRGPNFAEALEPAELVKAAVNQEHAELSAPVSNGDEVALFPPVTGG